MKFNDPYDSAHYYLVEELFKAKTYLEIKSFLEMPTVRDFLSVDQRDALRTSERLIETLLEMLFPDDAGVISRLRYDEIQGLNNFLRSDMRICSLSGVNDSIVMWSHYANNHMGFCLEYHVANLALDPTIIGWLHPVRYSSQLFDVTEYLEAAKRYFNSGGPLFSNWMAMIAACHKSPGWAYEKEWRIVALDSRDFFDVRPIRVISGARGDALPERKAALLRIADRLKLPIGKAVLRHDRFELAIEDA
jgi:hypothetical protein